MSIGPLGPLYDSARWKRMRTHQLQLPPLCKYWAELGRVTPATIVDHVEPHKGDVNKYWLGQLQSLCDPCHKATKHFEELHGYRPDIGFKWLAARSQASGLSARPQEGLMHPVFSRHGLRDHKCGRECKTPAGRRSETQ
jgi:5-methylcytosine-specific restriction enzyme A